MTSGYVYNKASSLPIPVTVAEDNTALGVKDVVFFLRMRWKWIAFTVLGFLVVAIAYVLLAKPSFVASTQLLVLPQVSASETQRASAEDAFIEAQLEIGNSSDVLGATAQSLELTTDPEFNDERLSLRDIIKEKLLGLTSSSATDETMDSAAPETRSQDQKKLDRVIVRLRNMVSFRRVGRSMILEISASSSNPEKAAKIANAVAQEYVRKNVRMNGAAAQQYSGWLQDFVAEQQRGLTEASNALLTYKSNPREQFKLAELQSAADARRALYETTLTRLTEAKQRISYPVSDATFVSQATPPLSKAHPRSGLIVAFAVTLGTTLGLMVAMIRHAGDRRIISARQLAKATTLPFALPLANSASIARNRSLSVTTLTASGKGDATLQASSGIGELSAIIAGLRRKHRTIIGVVGVDPNDGATTVALELALLSATSGSRTLLIDAAAPTASLSNWIAPGSKIGLAEVIDDATRLATAFQQITPNLKFLPLGNPLHASPAVRLSSRRTQVSLGELKKAFDTVIVDLTAFSSSPDANAIGPELDGILVITSHGRTSIDEATHAIESMRNVGTEVLGAIINKTPAGAVS